MLGLCLRLADLAQFGFDGIESLYLRVSDVDGEDHRLRYGIDRSRLGGDPELRDHGRVRRAYIGISAQQSAIPRRLQVAAGVNQGSAAMIGAVETASPAGAAGLMSGDLIVALDGKSITGADDLIRALTGERIGRAVEIDVLRTGKRRRFTVMPQERPARGH